MVKRFIECFRHWMREWAVDAEDAFRLGGSHSGAIALRFGANDTSKVDLSSTDTRAATVIIS